jgi:uncharacterized membrane-anchored protein
VNGREFTINYRINILGRKGVLTLWAGSTLEQLPLIESYDQKIASFTQFTPPNRYEDFDAATDAKANYTIADIITGLKKKSPVISGREKNATSSQSVIWIIFITLLAICAFVWKVLRQRNR